MAHEYILSTEDQEIVLNNIPFRVIGDIGFDLANNYSKQLAQGDPGPNDHAVDSTITQEDWTGGINVLKYKGDESRGNSWISTLWMQTNAQLTLNARTDEYTVEGESGYVYIHDKFNGVQWVTFGKKIKRWDEGSKSIEDPASGADSSTGTPSGPGVTWGDSTTPKLLYIPMGDVDEYETWDGTDFAVGTTNETAIDFVVWNQKLFKLDAEGAIKFTADGTTWTEKGYIPDDSIPRKLFVAPDAAGVDTVHVSTSGSVWALDFENGLLIETDFEYPEHPDQGRAATRWRTHPYISVGIGVHRKADGLIGAMGPDSKDGLPEEFSMGYFTSMTPSYNELIGAIAGSEISEVPIEETSDMGMTPPEGMYSQHLSRNAMVIGFNGLGWHPKWIGPREPTNVYVSSNDGVYRLFWGSLGAMYTQILPRGYYNPRYDQRQTPLERYGYHITPWFNWGFVDTPKILKQFEIKVLDADELNYVKVWIRYDDFDADWELLSTITTNGQHHLDTGFRIVGDREIHGGQPHERVQFKIELFGDENDDYSTPVIEWYTLVGRKWMRAVRVFSAQIDCTQPHKDRSPYTLYQELVNAARMKGGVPLVIGGESFVVDVTSDTGNIKAGLDWQSIHNVTMIDVLEFDNEEFESDDE